MKQIDGKYRQQGVALILSLLLLFVLVVLGVSGFSNTHIQERSAGNARLQTQAFEAASAGANNAINFFDANHDLGEDELCGSLDHDGWYDADGNAIFSDWVDMGTIGGATLKQRLYCLADDYPCTEEEVGCVEGERPPRSQLFVLSRGEVVVDGDVVAQRDVEVRLEVGSTGGAGDGCGAICFPACNTGTLNFPTSNSFQVDGNGGPAIAAGCQSAADNITNAIRSNRIGNYLGGIAATAPGSPWDSPESVELFRQNLSASAIAANLAGTCQTTCYSPGNLSNNGNSTYGTAGDPQITYINGNASFGGNISGAGILVVNGNLSWNGTPKFQGLILVLGGTFNVSGGGTGGDHGGSVVLLNHLGQVNGEFGSASFNFTGGGNALYQFNCASLMAAQDLLDVAGQGMWSPECDVAPQNPYEAGPDELVIASWRENIGWRDITE